MVVEHLIIHEVKKQVGSESQIRFSEEEISINEIAKSFIEQVREVYNKRTGRYNGIFNSDTLNYPFQVKLGSFIESEASFLELSKQSMRILKKSIDKQTLATGGYIIFSFYKQSNQDFLMVIMLHDKESYVIDDQLKLKNSFQLNLDELSMASRVNIGQWQENKDSYLTFVRGKKRQEVSGYFFEFLGCTRNTSSSESTSKLLNALTDFMNEKEYSQEQKSKIRERTFYFCDDHRKNKKQVAIIDLSNYLFENEVEAEEFFAVATSDRYKLDTHIDINRDKLRSLRVYKLSWRDITVSFPNGTPLVDIDEESRTLVLKEVPIKHLEQIRKIKPN